MQLGQKAAGKYGTYYHEAAGFLWVFFMKKIKVRITDVRNEIIITIPCSSDLCAHFFLLLAPKCNNEARLLLSSCNTRRRSPASRTTGSRYYGARSFLNQPGVVNGLGFLGLYISTGTILDVTLVRGEAAFA
jgi:hypothetical protein